MAVNVALIIKICSSLFAWEVASVGHKKIKESTLLQMKNEKCQLRIIAPSSNAWIKMTQLKRSNLLSKRKRLQQI